MIRFLYPWLLLLFVPLTAGALYLIVRRKRRPILRIIALVIAILALASPEIVRTSVVQNVLFLIDRSASVSLTTSDDQLRTRVQAIAAEAPDAQLGVIEFSDAATVTAPLGAPAILIGAASSLDESSTNLHRAIELALSILPHEEANQLVLVSDGQISTGFEEALALADLSDIPISVLPVGTPNLRDVSLASLMSATEIQVGRPFSIDLEIASPVATDATLILYRNSDVITLQELALAEGITPYSVTDTLESGESAVYQAIVRAADDPISMNDDLSVFVRSTDRPSVLYIDREPGSLIPELLDASGISYNLASSLPELEALTDYRQLVISGAAFASYTQYEIETLFRFSRLLGGGILFVGGEAEASGFSGGGIEDLLPVTFTMPEKSEEASLAIVYLLDRSSSMKAPTRGGALKIEVLKEATVASINLLDSEAQVGIVGFDSSQSFDWVVPIAPIESEVIYEGLRAMDALGGTDMYFPLVDALDALDAVEARSKHILLISDGKNEDVVRDWRGLVGRLEESTDITLSAIAVGGTPNTTLLGMLTNAADGTLYHAEDFSTLPQVSIRATQRLSRERFVTVPSDVAGSLIESLPNQDVPQLDGYVVSFPKETSETLIWSAEDPIVSTWRTGLGTVSILNTDLRGEWTQQWAGWGALPELFESLLATTEPRLSATLGLSASVALERGQISIIADARDDAGGFVDFISMEATLLPLDVTFSMEQVGPGLYHVEIPIPEKGGYALQIVDHTRGRSLTLPLTVPYADEYREVGPNRERLSLLASQTGGVMLDQPDAELPVITERRSERFASLQPLLLLCVLILFLLELVLRKWPLRKQRTP